MDLIGSIHNDLHKGALQLIAEHRARLYAEALGLCKNETDAEDLVIRTLDKAIRKIDTYSGSGDILSWMRSIMTNLHLNDNRAPVDRLTKVLEAETLEEYAEATNCTIDEVLRNSDSEVLHAALDHLDPEYKKVLVMHYFGELPVKNIALALNIPLGTVLWRLSVARRMLAKSLGPKLGKKPIAVLAAILLGVTTLFGAAVWGVVEAVNAVGSLASEGALETFADTIDPIVPHSLTSTTQTVPSPLSYPPSEASSEGGAMRGATGADTLSTNTNTNKEETMNIKSITKSAAKLAAGALLTTGLSANAGPVWTATSAENAVSMEETLNALRGKSPTVEVKGSGSGSEVGWVPSRWTDGTIARNSYERGITSTIGNNSSLTYAVSNVTTGAGVDVLEFRIFTCWDGNRDVVSLTSLEVQVEGSDDWAVIENSRCSLHVGVATAAVLKDSVDGKPLAERVTNLRINFAGQQNGYAGYSEFELMAMPRNALFVRGAPVEAVQDGEPAYGLAQAEIAAGATVTKTAPAGATFGGTSYECVGYVLETMSADGWTGGSVTNAGLTCTYVQTATETRRITWLWDLAGFSLSVVMPSLPLGAYSVSPQPSAAGSYKPGTRVTITATPASGHEFLRWYGDAEGTDASVEVTMDQNRSVSPYFSGSWVDAGAGKITDGYWTNGISGSSASLTIGGVSWHNGIVTKLDFSKPYDGGTFTKMGQAHYNSSWPIYEVVLPDSVTSIEAEAFRSSKIRSIVLPANLTTIGHMAFAWAGSLKSVTPFLPKGVVSVGSGAFAYAPIESDLIALSKNLTSLPSDGEHSCFYGGKFKLADLTKTSLTALDGNLFRGNGNLRTVKLPKSLSAVGACVFYDSGSVNTIYMPGKPVTSVSGNYGFGSIGNLAARLYAPKGDANWTAYKANNPDNVANLSDGEKETFQAKFPGEKVPRQKLKLPNSPWFYLCEVPPAGMMLILQ